MLESNTGNSAITENDIEVLNDLLKINNDRIEGYEEAIKEANGEQQDLRSLFEEMISQSRKYANELSAVIGASGGEPATDTTLSGKIYRAWMDVKAAFSASDRKTILQSCERGEDAAQNAYLKALDEELSDAVYNIISKQAIDLKDAHDHVKSLRDDSEND